MAIFDKIKGITLLNGFAYRAKAPLDLRLVLDSFNELAELVEADGAYEGMLVYVKNDTTVNSVVYPKGYYYCTDGENWEYFNVHKANVAETVKVNTDFGEGSYNATITLSKNDPTASEGTAGNIWFKYN